MRFEKTYSKLKSWEKVRLEPATLEFVIQCSNHFANWQQVQNPNMKSIRLKTKELQRWKFDVTISANKASWMGPLLVIKSTSCYRKYLLSSRLPLLIEEGGGGGQLAQILGKYVPQLNQKGKKQTHNPGKIFYWKTRAKFPWFYLFLPITRAKFPWFYLLPCGGGGTCIPGLHWELPPPPLRIRNTSCYREHFFTASQTYLSSCHYVNNLLHIKLH